MYLYIRRWSWFIYLFYLFWSVLFFRVNHLETILINEKNKHKTEVEKFVSMVIDLETSLKRTESTYACSHCWYCVCTFVHTCLHECIFMCSTFLYDTYIPIWTHINEHGHSYRSRDIVEENWKYVCFHRWFCVLFILCCICMHLHMCVHTCVYVWVSVFLLAWL